MTDINLPDTETANDRELTIQSIWNAMVSGEIDVNTAHRLACTLRPPGTMEADRDILTRLVLQAAADKEIDAATAPRLMSFVSMAEMEDPRRAQLRELERMLQEAEKKQPASAGD